MLIAGHQVLFQVIGGLPSSAERSGIRTTASGQKLSLLATVIKTLLVFEGPAKFAKLLCESGEKVLPWLHHGSSFT